MDSEKQSKSFWQWSDAEVVQRLGLDAATLRRELLALVAPTRAEAGNLVYNIHEEKDGAIFIYEVWRSQADLDKHMQLPHLKRFMGQVSAWLASDIEAYSGTLITPMKK